MAAHQEDIPSTSCSPLARCSSQPRAETTELTFDGSHVRIGCSPAQRIVVHGSPKLGKSFYNPDGSPITHAELDLPPIGEYVYFSVYTADGKAAHTRAFRRAELAE